VQRCGKAAASKGAKGSFSLGDGSSSSMASAAAAPGGFWRAAASSSLLAWPPPQPVSPVGPPRGAVPLQVLPRPPGLHPCAC
jgi:hypothetical protein